MVIRAVLWGCSRLRTHNLTVNYCSFSSAENDVSRCVLQARGFKKIKMVACVFPGKCRATNADEDRFLFCTLTLPSDRQISHQIGQIHPARIQVVRCQFGRRKPLLLDCAADPAAAGLPTTDPATTDGVREHCFCVVREWRLGLRGVLCAVIREQENPTGSSQRDSTPARATFCFRDRLKFVRRVLGVVFHCWLATALVLLLQLQLLALQLQLLLLLLML